MYATYYAYHALARDLAGLAGATFADAFTQHRDELRLVFEDVAPGGVPGTGSPPGGAAGAATLVFGARPVYLFAVGEAGRARRNVATFFASARGRRVRAVRVADRDRMLFVDFDDGSALTFVLYGARANVMLVADGAVREAFLGGGASGVPAPAPRPAALPDTAGAFALRFAGAGDPAHRLARAFPLFDPVLAAEALHRAGRGAVTEPDPARLFEVACALHAEALEAARPAVVWRGPRADAFTLVRLTHLGGAGEASAPGEAASGDDGDAAPVRVEPFASVSEALRTFVRRRLAQTAFERRSAGLHARLEAAAALSSARVERMLDELARPSRADGYERDGHVLMAALARVPVGAAEVTLPDVFEGGAARTIRLDPALAPAANAAALYGRARRTRASRANAEGRLTDADTLAREAQRLLDGLRAAPDLAALDAFERAEAAALARATRPAIDDARLPYHRVEIGHGYEAWIGRGAADNDALTLRHARPFDLWLHARGVTGSHVVVRLPGRTSVPPRAVVERAAELAAFHSKARPSGLVAVVVVPRKWVRKPKGSPPGSVVIEREEVLLVEPKGP